MVIFYLIQELSVDHELIYTSRAYHEMTQEELEELLVQSREKNSRLNITGLLVYGNQEFVQLLEGNKDDIFDLFHRIKKDERNYNVVLRWNGIIENRSFNSWSMAFINSDKLDHTINQSYSRYLQDGISSLDLTGSESLGRKLLLWMRNDFL